MIYTMFIYQLVSVHNFYSDKINTTVSIFAFYFVNVKTVV
jgi:hypothetical protein